MAIHQPLEGGSERRLLKAAPKGFSSVRQDGMKYSRLVLRYITRAAERTDKEKGEKEGTILLMSAGFQDERLPQHHPPSLLNSARLTGF